MKILYIIIGDLGNLSSGSGLRPNCMYNAFLERGHTVYVLAGFEGRGQGKNRAKEVEKAKIWVEENKPDLCYIESSTYPMLHQCDYDMIRYLNKKKIPTSYFYRDFYRKFPELFPKRKGFINCLKEKYLDIMQCKTDKILRYIDIVYFPSEQCFKYFSYKSMKALPPAGTLCFLPEHKITNTCIYVGGVSEFYGFPLLLKTFELLNKDEDVYKLILVCREREFKSLNTDISKYSWLEVHHASGKELEPLYEKSDVGLLTLTDNEYSNLAVGTKLFQYLSYGLPVVSTNSLAMATIINNNGFGEVSKHTPEAFACAIKRLLENQEQYNVYKTNVKQNMADRNLWVHRVDTIVNDLL